MSLKPVSQNSTLPFLDNAAPSTAASPSEAAPSDVSGPQPALVPSRQTNANSSTDSDITEGAERIRPQRKRRRMLKFSAFLVIVLPTLASAIYYGFIASSQYAVEVRFAVRGTNSGSGTDLLGMVTGIPSGSSTIADSYILIDYIRSREFLDKLRKTLPLNKIYGSERADYLSAFDPNDPIEEFVRYWRKMITINFDSGSQIVAVEVKAFTPEDAKTVAEALLTLSEELVNNLSARARIDAVSHAEKEVARMEKRLKINRQAVRAFREKEQVIDPSKTAESRLSLLARLEGELGVERAKLSALSPFMSARSPRIRVLTSKIKALEKQVEAERNKLGASRTGSGKTSGPLTGLLASYQILLMEQEFSEKAYISALSSLEAARLEASRQQRYLATFVRPSLPEDSLYPKRLLIVITIFVLSGIIWAISVLIVYSIRDHAV